LPSLR